MPMLKLWITRLRRQPSRRGQISLSQNLNDMIDFFNRSETQSLPSVFEQIDRPTSIGCWSWHRRIVRFGAKPTVRIKMTMNPKRQG
jgi:hypothetical protein